MGLTDVAGIFSRKLVIGFFLPVFFVLVALSQLLTVHLQPDFYSGLESDGSRVLVLGGIALFGGLLLSGLHWNILRLFEGYPLESWQHTWPVSRVYGKALRGQRKRFHDFHKDRMSTSTIPAKVRARARAKQALAELYPPACNELLPTSFGNAVRSFERHSDLRWGLIGLVAWPRIELLMNEQQLDLNSTAQTDVAFFVNSTVLAVLSGGLFIYDWIAYTSIDRIWSWLLLAIPFALAFLAYKAAVTAAVSWGAEVRAAVDVYRLDLYKRLGVRVPKTDADERLVTWAVNRTLAYGDALPGSVREGWDT